jgi:hypothetical protein
LAPGTLAAGLSSPQAVVLGPDNVYWTTAKAVSTAGSVGDASAAPGSIETVLRIGGGVEEIVVGLSNPGPLALVGSTLFFGTSSGGEGTLGAFTIGTTKLDTITAGQPAAFPIVTNVNALDWATGTGATFAVASVPSIDPAATAITRIGGSASSYVPLALTVLGSSAYVLATAAGTAYILEVTPGTGDVGVLWSEAGATPVDLTGNGAALYWTLSNTPTEGGEVLTTSTGGGSVVTLASNVDRPAKIALHDDTLYFTSNVASGAVLSVSTSGGAVSTVASGLDYPDSLAVDDAVYVATSSAIVKVGL